MKRLLVALSACLALAAAPAFAGEGTTETTRKAVDETKEAKTEGRASGLDVLFKEAGASDEQVKKYFDTARKLKEAKDPDKQQALSAELKKILTPEQTIKVQQLMTEKLRAAKARAAQKAGGKEAEKAPDNKQ